MTTQEMLLSATIENWLYRHGVRIQRGSVSDVARRMLSAGVLARADTGELVSRAGGSPVDVLAIVEEQAPHLFRGPDEAAAPAVAPTKPSGPKPSAAARLEMANGDLVRKTGHGR